MQDLTAKCVIAGSIVLMISIFMNIIHLINSYGSNTENRTTQVISAFDG